MNRSNRITRLSLVCCALGASAAAAAQPGKISAALEALQSVHSLVEVALSPDGSTVIYGDTVKGKRGDAEVDASALWIINARDGGNARRLTACPGTICDEHGAAWSPDGRQIAFVTTDESEQPQIAKTSSRRDSSIGSMVTCALSASSDVSTPLFRCRVGEGADASRVAVDR